MKQMKRQVQSLSKTFSRLFMFLEFAMMCSEDGIFLAGDLELFMTATITIPLI